MDLTRVLKNVPDQDVGKIISDFRSEGATVEKERENRIQICLASYISRGGKLMRSAIVTMLALCVLAGTGSAKEFKVVTYNVESDKDIDPARVAADISEIGPAEIWGLQEVEDKDALRTFRAAMEADDRRMWYELPTTGGGSKLAIVYDRERFEPIGPPNEPRDVGGSREPFWIKLKDKHTGLVFFFVTNHFNRDSADAVLSQSNAFRSWISNRTDPVIAVGTYYFDLNAKKWRDTGTRHGNEAFNIFMEDPAPVEWAEHKPKLSTNCTNPKNVLDFIFLGGPAKSWESTVNLMFPTKDYCMTERTGRADHRPIVATLTPREAGDPGAGGQEEAVQAEIDTLRSKLEELEALID